MTIVRCNPRRGYMSPERNLNQMYEIMDNIFVPHKHPESFSPLTNVIEGKLNYRIELSLAGFNRSEINLSVENDTLKISGRREINLPEGEEYSRREFRNLEFEKSFVIPEDVNQESIQAGMEQGVLSVMLPKKEEALQKPARNIQVS
jgi:HSP20 family protein